MTHRIEQLAEGKVTLLGGDCLTLLATLEANSIDACVTDPPYGLEFMGKEWDRFSGAVTDRDFKGFVLSQQRTRNVKCPDCGKWAYDHPGRLCQCGGIRRAQGSHFQFFCEAWASEVFRVLKPGGHLLSFGGTRTYHRMACAIEDAGFEIRDTIMWVYGQGYPKSLDVSKAIDKAAGEQRERIRGIRSGVVQDVYAQDAWSKEFKDSVLSSDPITDDARQWSGFGTALKPACEPIVLARKPLSESTVAANCLKWGVGALNIDACRVGTTKRVPGGISQEKPNASVYGKYGIETGDESGHDPNVGRWPANVILDSSEEVQGAFPDVHGAGAEQGKQEKWGDHKTDGWGNIGFGPTGARFGDSGSAARFFYTAKADSDDRLGSKHPCVKPLDLMQYLCRLVCPPKGLVLDCFAGTGTTGEAAFREGMRAVLIEREEEYQADIIRRMSLCMSSRAERAREGAKARFKDKPLDMGPLFGGTAEAVGGRMIYGVFADEKSDRSD